VAGLRAGDDLFPGSTCRLGKAPIDYRHEPLEGDHLGKYRHGFLRAGEPFKARISRADVADCMLKRLADDTHLRETPAVPY
jgi:hypothetical protein